MLTRLTWSICGAAVVLAIAAAARSLPLQQPPGPPPRQDSFSSGAGPVTESVMASWQSHGADDGPIAPTPSVPLVIPADASTGGRITAHAPHERASALNQDWMLDLLVLWRWSGRAPEITQSGGGDAGLAGPVVHRIVVTGGRELRVVFDRRAGSVAVQEAASVLLDGTNVLMLDVDAETVRVEGLATVEPRYSRLSDPVEAAIARSPKVAAFVGAR